MDLGQAVNSAANWLSTAPLINKIVVNPIYTALLLTALALVVLLALYGPAVRRQGWKPLARLSVFFALIFGAVTFVHHYATMRAARACAANRGMRDIFEAVHSEQAFGGGYPVMPDGGPAPPAPPAPYPAYGPAPGPAPTPAPAPAPAPHPAPAPRPAPGAPRADNVPAAEVFDLGGGFTITDAIVPIGGMRA